MRGRRRQAQAGVLEEHIPSFPPRCTTMSSRLLAWIHPLQVSLTTTLLKHCPSNHCCAGSHKGRHWKNSWKSHTRVSGVAARCERAELLRSQLKGNYPSCLISLWWMSSWKGHSKRGQHGGVASRCEEGSLGSSTGSQTAAVPLVGRLQPCALPQ
jgi:hypothetical protein